MQQVYLDNAATTTINDQVIETIYNAMKTSAGNPSSTHQFGRKARAGVELARKTIAKLMHCQVNEVIFTAGGTEANNLILNNAVVNLGVKKIISSKIEHHAVLNTIQYLQQHYQIEVAYVKLNADGSVDLNDLENLVANSSNKTLVSLMYVNNEIGNLLNLEKVIEICSPEHVYFHSDAVQGIPHYSINLTKNPIDFISASAHKFHGPKGVGFAIIKKQFGIQPIIIGGEQEHGARAGTENVHSIIGMAKALELAHYNLDQDRQFILSLKKYFIDTLKTHFSNITFNGLSHHLEASACHIVNARFDKEYPMLLFQLDLKGVAVSGGSACQSGSHKGSHVLNTILPPDESLKTSIRFSFSKYNTLEDIDYTIKTLKDIID